MKDMKPLPIIPEGHARLVLEVFVPGDEHGPSRSACAAALKWDHPAAVFDEVYKMFHTLLRHEIIKMTNRAMHEPENFRKEVEEVPNAGTQNQPI